MKRNDGSRFRSAILLRRPVDKSSTQSTWAVPASHDERRYLVLDVGDAQRRNREYFGAIRRQMEEEGGYAALLHMLLTMDLSGFDVTAVPDELRGHLE